MSDMIREAVVWTYNRGGGPSSGRNSMGRRATDQKRADSGGERIGLGVIVRKVQFESIFKPLAVSDSSTRFIDLA